LIHKVNRPSYLSLVSQPKQTENDPGSSQGSGNFYEKQPSKDAEPPPQKPAPTADESLEDEHKAKLAVVVTVEQIGMGEVVTEFLENKKGEAPVSPGLSVRYTSDSQPAKGLLLNKKAE
jgi:hypothetical protein